MRNVLGVREILSRQDWVYLLSLLVPFVIYNLAQKVASVLAQSGERGVVRTLDLMQSDIFFNLGYALLWVALFVMTPRGLLRRVVIVFFHVATILVLLVTTCSHQYFRQNGTSLDYGTIAEWLPKFGEIVPILVHDVPLLAWVLLAVALLYAAFGPLLVTRAAGRWWGEIGS